MREVPRTCYTSVGRDHIAYQVFGAGPPDLVFVPSWNTNVEALWEMPPLARFVGQLATFGRVVLFDKRGTGLSDGLSTEGQPLLEQFADDLRAVLDAVGTERATLIAGDASGLVAIVFAASHPERVGSLVFVNAFAGLTHPDDHANERDIVRIWFDGDISPVAPSVAEDRATVEQIVRYFRQAARPNAAYETRAQILGLDVRDVLPAVQAPTLVIHRAESRYFTVHHARHLAQHIPGARLVELPGCDHLMYVGDTDAVLSEIEMFVTGERRRDVTDRVLTTVLFVDIVQSTSRMASVGDHRWRELLDRYDGEVERNIEAFRGRQVKNTGDGTLAVFDGPARAIRCALSLRDALRADGVELRSGLHTGEVEMRGDDVTGIAVHTAQRVQAFAQPDEVLVSRTVVDLVDGSGIEFRDRGEHALEGIPTRWRLFSVVA